MDSENQELHYHIRWSRVVVLDWESFRTRAEADARAKELVRLDETYVIEEHDETCPRCRVALELKTIRPQAAKAISEAVLNLKTKYPWQQAVVDASRESRPECLRGKVNVAECAIAARLRDAVPADLDEQLAIREALALLQSLLPHRAEPGEQSAAKKNIA